MHMTILFERERGWEISVSTLPSFSTLVSNTEIERNLEPLTWIYILIGPPFPSAVAWSHGTQPHVHTSIAQL